MRVQNLERHPGHDIRRSDSAAAKGSVQCKQAGFIRDMVKLSESISQALQLHLRHGRACALRSQAPSPPRVSPQTLLQQVYFENVIPRGHSCRSLSFRQPVFQR
jgi:hypothetical protein